MTDIKFFRVGGCVRDRLMGVESKDIDFSVEAPDFPTMLAAVEARCSKVFRDNDGQPIGAKFFTVRGLDPEFGAVDFVLCRKDGPSVDGRHPEFVEPGTIFDDLARRDFTVNAIAEDAETGNLIDPHRGAVDLRSRTLRFVGNPTDRLREDALRAFRGFRFQITKGLTLDSAAASAIRSLEPDQFSAVSTERIREELTKCFVTDTAQTLLMLGQFPTLLTLALDRGLWLKPTTESAGRPAMRTRDQNLADLMVRQGWTVTDIDVSPLP